MGMDLGQVVLVTESSNRDRPGDIDLFRTTADAERKLEAIDVENKEFFAYLLDGRELNLLVVDGRVRIEPYAESEDHRNRIRAILEAYGKTVVKARKHRGKLTDEPSLSIMPLVELIEFIGFTR